MKEVIIKSVNRKTTIPKTVIKKAAKIAYATPKNVAVKKTSIKKVSKAA